MLRRSVEDAFREKDELQMNLKKISQAKAELSLQVDELTTKVNELEGRIESG